MFDHILASRCVRVLLWGALPTNVPGRYLRERDAAKLFAQLLSGVWYIHQVRGRARIMPTTNLHPPL